MINFFVSIFTSKKTQMHIFLYTFFKKCTKKVQCTERHCNYLFFNHDDDGEEVKVTSSSNPPEPRACTTYRSDESFQAP